MQPVKLSEGGLEKNQCIARKIVMVTRDTGWGERGGNVGLVMGLYCAREMCVYSFCGKPLMRILNLAENPKKIPLNPRAYRV